MTHIDFQEVTRKGFYIHTVLQWLVTRPNFLCNTFRIPGRISLLLFLLSVKCCGNGGRFV